MREVWQLLGSFGVMSVGKLLITAAYAPFGWSVLELVGEAPLVVVNTAFVILWAIVPFILTLLVYPARDGRRLSSASAQESLTLLRS